MLPGSPPTQAADTDGTWSAWEGPQQEWGANLRKGKGERERKPALCLNQRAPEAPPV